MQTCLLPIQCACVCDPSFLIGETFLQSLEAFTTLSSSASHPFIFDEPLDLPPIGSGASLWMAQRCQSVNSTH